MSYKEQTEALFTSISDDEFMSFLDKRWGYIDKLSDTMLDRHNYLNLKRIIEGDRVKESVPAPIQKQNEFRLGGI